MPWLLWKAKECEKPSNFLQKSWAKTWFLQCQPQKKKHWHIYAMCDGIPNSSRICLYENPWHCHHDKVARKRSTNTTLGELLNVWGDGIVQGHSTGVYLVTKQIWHPLKICLAILTSERFPCQICREKQKKLEERCRCPCENACWLPFVLDHSCVEQFPSSNSGALRPFSKDQKLLHTTNQQPFCLKNGKWATKKKQKNGEKKHSKGLVR